MLPPVKPLFIWNQIREFLSSRYNIIGDFEVGQFREYPNVTYNHLKSLHKQVYLPNDRIIIGHYDTDFYLENIGFNLYNLFSCLREVDISLDFVVLLTNHYGIRQEINNICSKLNIHSAPLTVFENSYHVVMSPENPKETTLDPELIQYSFICLQSMQRTHRVFFSCLLKEHNLINKGILSWHFNTVRQDDGTTNFSQSRLDLLPNGLKLATTIPFTAINEMWPTTEYIKEIYSKHYQYFLSDFKHYEIDSDPYSDNRDYLLAIKKSFLYVSVETVFNYPYPYLTEKTFKAVLHKRPFIIVGAKGSLQQLKSLGFKTFDQYWDESYDQIDDPNARLLALINIVKDISSKDINTLKNMCYNMQHILDFNLTHYIEHYSNTDLYKKLEDI